MPGYFYMWNKYFFKMKFKHNFRLSLIVIMLFLGASNLSRSASLSSDRNLVIVHEQTFGGIDIDYNYALINGSDGGYIMAGHTRSYGEGLDDGWIVKVDTEGNLQWNCTYGGTNEDCFTSIIPTPDEGYALTGTTESYGGGQWDMWLMKIGIEGNVQWEKTYGGLGRDYGASLALLPDGGYIIAGYTESNSLGVLGDRDFYLVKTDNLGNLLWEHTYGGSNSERASSVIVTSEGDFILIGLTETSSQTASQNIWIVKTDSNGLQMWNRTIGGPSSDFPYAAIPSSDDGIIITGKTESYGVGGSDVWLVKTDASGNSEWNSTFGGTGNEYATSIISTLDGGYVLSGRTSSYGAGGEDMWLIKTSSSGVLEYNQTFGGINADVAYGVIQNGNKGYIMAGRTSSYGAGAEDIWFIDTTFETHRNSISGFSTGVILLTTVTFVIIRGRGKKKKKCDEVKK